jgi:predicted acylesterase/phospholipase RssA
MRLCLGSGGIRAASIIGALKELPLQKFDSYSGISMGSLLALGLRLGYTAENLEELFLKIDLKKLLKPVSPEEWLLLPKTKSFCDPTPLRVLLKNLLDKKGLKEDILLKDFPQFSVVVSNLSKGKPELWSNETVADEPLTVIDAVVTSCSIPFVFPPYVKESDKSVCVDGCLFVDSPAQMFESDEHCFSVILQNNKETYNCESLTGFCYAAIQSPRRYRTLEFLKTYDPKKFISIDLNNVGTLQTELSLEAKQELIRVGSEAVKQFKAAHENIFS